MSTTIELANKAIRSSLVLGGVTTLSIGLLGGVIGYFIDSWTGVVSALLGALVAFVFMGVTAMSILVGLKVSHGSVMSGAFFAIVLGAWLLKFALFLGALYLIKNLTDLNSVIAFMCVIVAVIGALFSDVIAISRARVPVVDMIGS
ncbi:MAG: hypothetical protein RLZ72_1082 [Actinomycetota bacterium]|jgi:hypothetical protein